MYRKEDIRPKRFTGLVLRRVGAYGDGGYVLPEECLSETKTLLSLGLSLNWSFDDEFAELTGAKLIGVDGSLTRLSVLLRIGKRFLDSVVLRFLSGTRCRRRWLDFREACRCYGRLFGSQRGSEEFLLKWVGGKNDASVVTVEHLLGLCSPERHSVFLKMDIEGAEFTALNNVIENAERFNGLVVEFHGLIEKWREFRELLAQLGGEFEIVHVHGNNNGGVEAGSALPDILEVTFVHQSLVAGRETEAVVSRYPVAGIDVPCNAEREDIVIDFQGHGL